MACRRAALARPLCRPYRPNLARLGRVGSPLVEWIGRTMITVEIKDDEITKGLGALSLIIGDLSPVMDQIGEFMVQSTRKRISSGVTPDGKKLAPKSATTIQNYLTGGYKKGATAGPLIRTGDLVDRSLHYESGSDFMEIASSAVYSAVMHFGAAKGSFGAYSGTDKNGRAYSGVAPWGDIPARPFFGVSQEDRENIFTLISDTVFHSVARHIGTSV
jgi:phage gpG-like protein